MNSKIKIFLLIFSAWMCVSNFTFGQQNQFENQIRLAKLYEARGDLENAAKIYADLHKLQPENYLFYQSLSKIYISQKKYQEALELTKNQLNLVGNSVNLYGDLGTLYFLMGDEPKAMSIWDDALNLEPGNAFAYRIIADYLIENRIIDRAIEILKLGSEVADDKTIFSYDIANLYSLTMNYEEATKEYCKILVQKPKQINLVKNRIESYINSNQAVKPTLETVEKFYNEDENIVFLELLSDLYTKTDNREKALEATIKIDEETTKNGSSIFAFAQQAFRDIDYKSAAKAYKLIVQNYPSSALYSEAEIGYTRSLEADLNRKSVEKESWKPLIIQDSKNLFEFNDLLTAYKNLAGKYSENKVGWEAEFRVAKIYLDNLNQYDKADSALNKIVTEVKSVLYIDDSYFGLAQIAVEKNDLDKAEKYLAKVTKSRIAKAELISNANFLWSKIKMWKGEFSESIEFLKKVTEDPKEEYVNDALQYSLILNTFKNDSTNLFLFANADYLVERNKFEEASVEFKKLADNKDLFLLNDFAALRYVELKLALNNYQEAVIFLEAVSNSDVEHIYEDRFLYLLGSDYYYGLKEGIKALVPLTRIFDEFPNSIYYNKARKIISEINEEIKDTI